MIYSLLNVKSFFHKVKSQNSVRKNVQLRQKNVVNWNFDNYGKWGTTTAVLGVIFLQLNSQTTK